MSSTASASSRRFPGPRSAFTLIEVLVAVALVTITLGLAAMVLITMARSATEARLAAEAEAELLRVGSILRHQMLAIAVSSSTQTPVVAEVGTEARSDTLDIVTAALVYARSVGRVEWRMIRNTGEEPYLAYREAPYLGGEDPKNNPWVPFSRLIRGVEFRFWSSPSWVQGWHRPEVPTRMRAILWYNGPNGEESFVIEAAPGVGQEEIQPISFPGDSSSPSPSSSPSTSPSTGPGGGTGTTTSGGPSTGTGTGSTPSTGTGTGTGATTPSTGTGTSSGSPSTTGGMP